MEETAKEYELMCILSPRLEEGDLNEVKNEISTAITRLEGTINFKESSKKPLAYPVNKEKQGIYLISQLFVFPEKLIEFSKNLKMNKRILRHLISRMEIQRESEKPRIIKKTIKPRKTIIAKKDQSMPEKSPSKTLEEIDKKLDQIIGEI